MTVRSRAPRSRRETAPAAAAVSAAVLLALACSARTPVVAPDVAVEPLPEAPLPVYRLQVGDLLGVRFWGNPELDDEVRIRPDGRISLPFVDEVVAAGRTPADLDQELTRRYASELARPEITVIVREVGGQVVYVGGEVDEPGALPLAPRMTVFQAIQQAGGLLVTARRHDVLLIRTPPEGPPVARSIDLMKVLSGADPSADVALSAYDVVFVPRTRITNVNLFVTQYLTQLLPIRPVATFDLSEDEE